MCDPPRVCELGKANAKVMRVPTTCTSPAEWPATRDAEQLEFTVHKQLLWRKVPERSALSPCSSRASHRVSLLRVLGSRVGRRSSYVRKLQWLGDGLAG